jgi:hypothetical protein
MPALESKLRSQLDDVCQKARDKAEEAARSALQKRAVDAAEPHAHFTPAEKELRNRLRARGRQAGDSRRANKTQGIEQLVQELAYEYWHRMLFARLLAENHLLMHPHGVAVSLEECDELAKSEGTPNGFVLAARYASKMLPQVFRTDDVLLEVEFAPEHRLALEKLLASLPRETFLADDSLGWVYQFWQSKRKDEVNKSGEKIDGRTLPAVTQLFTEDYMVQFLLHNTIGAWWAAKEGLRPRMKHGTNTDEKPEYLSGGIDPYSIRVPSVALPAFEYLRWRDDGTPAAGTFDGWPKTLQQFKMIDPCCGSGHFLVAAFNLLVPLRMHDEGLTAREACDAVLRENLFGLELDPRCTQIAAFALAVAAWKFPDLSSPSGRGAGGEGQPLGYRDLPTLNIACTGIGPQATEDEWLKLAEQSVGRIANPSCKPMTVLSREPILNGLRNLHALFSNAPTLGSLIDPNQLSADLITADYETLQPYLAAALTAETTDDDAHERAVAAAGMAKAAELLAAQYTLVTTNVPYLGRGKQSDVMQNYLDVHYKEGKADLATAFVLRCLDLCCRGGSAALVTPQTWLFLTTYKKLRGRLFVDRKWNAVARLGPNAFQDMNFWAATTALTIISATTPADTSMFFGIDVSVVKEQVRKAARLANLEPAPGKMVKQADQLKNPDAALSFELNCGATRLSEYANATQGMGTGDLPKYLRQIVELPTINDDWNYFQTTPDTPGFSGCEAIIRWERGFGELARIGTARKGLQVVGKRGVAIAVTGSLLWCHFLGTRFDCTIGVLIPNDESHLLAVLCFLSDPAFKAAVRALDQAVSVTEANLLKVPFDVAHWQKVAAEKYPNGLPEPESDDPTQWLFHGRPEESTAPLQVTLARLLGHRWPAELDAEMRLSERARALVRRCDELLKFAADDGIVCIPAIRAEPPADERLLEVLRAAYGPKWSNSLLHDPLSNSCKTDWQSVLRSKPGTTLDDWLRNAFFEQHCKMFQNRPFIWQVWDGCKDGFSCLLNYHKLDYKTLDNLTHAYLEAWIKKQAGDAKTGKVGADLRLAAAQGLQAKLKLILAGEPPYDIFVRWKPLHEQAIGWNPDLNDGVRMNIRPFVEAGILRKVPNIKWTKDRGKEPERDKDEYPWFWNDDEFVGDRVNDVHLTNVEKQAARITKSAADGH